VALVVEPHAGIPVLRQPLRGTRNESQACGQVVSDPMAPLQPTSSPIELVADRALKSAEHLPKLAETSLTWLPRGPATWREAQEGLAQAQPATRASRLAGDR
jgi:hypothetical protein